MSNQQRARLPRTPSNSSTSQRLIQNIDVQNNSINAMGENFTSQGYNNNNISDDALSVLGPDLAIQTSQVLENLTDQERSIILDVLSRDESIRQRDAARLMFLRTELHNLKKRKTGVNSLDRSVPPLDSNRSCARCRIDLGRILNRGTTCRACKLRICKGCREFTSRTEWMCIVCYKQIELQNASSEWVATEISIRTPPRRSSISQPGYIPTAEIIKKSISRSWTISNPEDDQLPNEKNGVDKRIIQSNLHSHEPSSFPNLIRLNKSPYSSNMDFSKSPDNYERTPPTSRRILRQSTLPNPTEIPVFSSNLKLPSPQKHVSPQYSPYHTDNENESGDGETSSGQQPQRYQIRRQSTLPCKPNELYMSQSSKYLSTSPNRSFSRSPDPSAMTGGDGDKSPRFCPPFVRQATFPSNSSNGISAPPMEYHQRQLPTSPNRLSVNKSPENPNELPVSPRRFMRQTTLPNPDQHMKLLPTSPPNKKSPQYHKRSPEFQRQNTISNPEGMSTLSVHHSGPKFLPISPRQKQNFLFPQPAPRAFLSQQHFPTTNEEHLIHPQHPQSKMIKVRSHSNEEYSFSRSLPPPNNQEGRRLLPEIPNRARSPSRLVRQENVMDEGEKRSPVLKTFAEAMLNQEYDSQYTSEYSELNSTFAEADENNYIENNSYDEQQNTTLQYAAEQTIDYYNSDEYMRQMQKRVGRRMSRELPPDPEVIIAVSEDNSRKNKPETMRSISEDTNSKTMKILPRRSFSQPEKDSLKKQESPQQSPKLLEESSQLPPQKEQCDENDEAHNKVPKKPTYKFPKMLEMRGDSKSFDAVVRQVINKNENKNGIDDADKSQSMDESLFHEKKEHKSTLNEAEIQSAVEQAAGLFKKVVLQRRKEKKPVEDGEMAGRGIEEICGTLPVKDYRFCFVSSSESSEEKEDDGSIADECDWDYFIESSTSSIHGNSVIYSHDDTSSTSDDEILSSSSAKLEAEGHFPKQPRIAWEKVCQVDECGKRHACKCSTTQYVAVPVPILIPMESLESWNKVNNPDTLLKLLNTSNLLYQHQRDAHDVTDTTSQQQNQQVRFRLPARNINEEGKEKEETKERSGGQKEKIGNVSIISNIESCISCCSSALQARHKNLSITSSDNECDNEHHYFRGKEETLSEIKKFPGQNKILGSSLSNVTTHLSETIKITNKHESTTCDCLTNCVCVGVSSKTREPHTISNLIKTASCSPNAVQDTPLTSFSRGAMISVGKLKLSENDDGYLVSESIFSTSSTSSDDEEKSCDGNCEGPSRPIVQRSYDVAGASTQTENLLSDNESSSNESCPIITSDSEDTGIDDRKRVKLKKFTKVFVVNKEPNQFSETDSCSSSNALESSTSEEIETSDNDTDTDGIILNYIKPINSDSNQENSSSEATDNEIVVLNSIKPIDNDFVESVDKHNDKIISSDESTNAVIDDKNNYYSPSKNSGDDTNQMIDDDLIENVSIIDSLEPLSSVKPLKLATDGVHNEISERKIVQSCNLSMILDGSYASKRKEKEQHETDDVKTSSEINLEKIESPLQHDSTEPNLQTSYEIVNKENNDNVPQIKTGLPPHANTERSTNVAELLLSDQQCLAFTLGEMKTPAGSNYNNNTILQNNSCVKQMNVNEEKVTAAQELLSVENASVLSEQYKSADGSNSASGFHNNKFKSLVMITSDNDNNNTDLTMNSSVNVSVIPNDTTRIITNNSCDDPIVVQHKNWQHRELANCDSGNNSNSGGVKSKIGFYEENISKVKEISNVKAKKLENPKEEKSDLKNDLIEPKEDDLAPSPIPISSSVKNDSGSEIVVDDDDVKVVTGQKTLSAVICLEDGLADDDSWVEEMSQNDEEEEFQSTETGSDFESSGDEMSLLSSAIDREEELRGYNRVSIDFTLHTIVEESCEESEYESSDRKSERISASELEKYFFFGLGGGHSSGGVGNHEERPTSLSLSTREHDESPSETSSVCSEGLDSLNTPENENVNECGNISSRLEKYFLSGFMGFQNNDDDNEGSDGSGSVGSDSEGRPSPEQRRKKLVRARGGSRSHNSSLDNLLTKEESLEKSSLAEIHQEDIPNDESDTEENDDHNNHCDTVKRKKKNKKLPEVEIENPSDGSEHEKSDDNGNKTPQPELLLPAHNSLVQSRKQHSRDSGFIGSNDDLLKSDGQKSPEMKTELAEIQEEIKENENSSLPESSSPQPFVTSLIRKDSFNAWSSDEETNLMMTKMRQFFKSLVAASKTSSPSSVASNVSPKVQQKQQRLRPPQLIYFENELTRLMKTVPGVTETQVKELVEYLSSEDTWSDSYDSSDYTSSDKESTVANKNKSLKIQQQISASCQEIIEKFDNTRTHVHHDEEGDMGDGGVLEDGINKETAFVYQKLVASISKKIADEKPPLDGANSPPIIAKVMHHIGSRLVALMHEVSSGGESMKSNSPKQPSSRHHHRRAYQGKISVTTTEDEDDDSTSAESNFGESTLKNLPRSKSHDLLLDGNGSGTKPSQDHIMTEERDASDYERFSWRGSFESALLTNCDSRNKLDNSSNSALSILAAKRRSAGDLLFSPNNNLSHEQLDRVRSCGSIGGVDHDLENSKLWESTQSQESSIKRVGCISDDTDESSDNDQQRLTHQRSTLPRSLQASTAIAASTTNSLPRLPTTSSSSSTQSSGVIQKFFQGGNVKSARYRAPGFIGYRAQQNAPKRALSAPGLQPFLARRERRNKTQSLAIEEQISSADRANSPISKTNEKISPSSADTQPSDPWPASHTDESDIDRLVAMHQNRHNSLSSLGLRSDSMASVYSGAGEGRYGTVQVKGMVEFGMQYNYKQCALEIHVKQCKDLAAVDTKRNRSDPYVKVYLLPDKTKSGKRKTKVKKHTLNPVFDEVLRFYMSLSSLESRTLWLTVWHSDMFGRNDFLGEVMISLQNKVFDNPMPQWYQLEERSEPFEDVTTYRGDIIVGLKFVPGTSSDSTSSGSTYSHGLSLRKFSIKSSSSANSQNNGMSSSSGGSMSCSKTTKGSLHVLVKEAKHLSPIKANGHCDAFCKSYLLPDKNRSSKQKTAVMKRTTNPQWNYTFIYEDVTLADLSERALELTIWDHDRLASNEFLGGVRFSLGTGKHYGKSVEWNDANGKELTLWQSMINRPNFWVEGCLALRSSLDRTPMASAP